jgi:hypothetical protein
MAREPALTEPEAEHLTFRDVVVLAILLSVLIAENVGELLVHVASISKF